MKRRDFLSQTGALSALSFGTPVQTAVSQSAKGQPPNVLFIICDQMRGDCMSGIGHPNARTPHIDQLAKEGTLFTRAFSNSPVCVPSRMSMFAGKYPHQTGRLSNKHWDSPLLTQEDTLADFFIRQGYRTGWIGKNHTYQKGALEGFDTLSIRAREPMRKYSRWVPPHWHSDTFWKEEDCYPKKNTDEAIAFLKSAKKSQPFFLHVSYFDPHPPYMAPAEYTRRYCSADMVLPDTVAPSRLSRRLDDFAQGFRSHHWSDADLSETLRYYYAAIEWGVDAQVGRLMETLNQIGMRDNTLVIFASDHGDFMGHYRMVRKGMFLYDSLLHVPMIWSAPGRIAENRRSDVPVELLDIFPTLMDYVQGKEREDLEGVSIRPLLEGENHRMVRDAILTSGGYGAVDPNTVDPSLDLDDPDDTPLHTRVMEQNMMPYHRTKMLRTREWKLILNEADEAELYHLNGGVYERENVIDDPQHAAVRRELESRLRVWWEW